MAYQPLWSCNARRIRLVLSFVYVLGFKVWVFVMFYYTWLDFDEEVGFF